LYTYIKGMVTQVHGEHQITLENQGVGYLINTSLQTVSALPDSSNSVTIYTHLHVREDVLALYGFLTQEELKVFLLLSSVSGVGPKASLSIMSLLSPSKFSMCVITGDANLLTKAQGIGKKTAERIILELKDKVKKEQKNLNGSTEWSTPETFENQAFEEALEALMVLGYKKEDAFFALRQNQGEQMDLESLIKKTLKSLSNS
jgi:holliday junction DNA helicase RuvA